VRQDHRNESVAYLDVGHAHYKLRGCRCTSSALDCGMRIPVNFTLNIDAEATDTDEALRLKARKQVDLVLRTIREAAGEFVWNQIEQNIGRSKGGRPAHVRDSGERAIEKASNVDRSDLEEELFQVLKIQRGQFEASRD